MRINRTLTYCWAVAAAVLLSACGGDGTTSPSGSGVSLMGTVLSGSGSSGVSAQSTSTASSSAARLVVTVQENPSLSATVSANGTFTLENLPAGEFTLVFTSGGTVVGSITITGVAGGTEVKIVVQITPDGVILIEIKIEGEIGEPSPNPSPSPSSSPTTGGSCMINGGRAGDGIELEGDVASGNNQSFKLSVNRASGLVSINASGAAYRCVGQSGKDCKANLKVGAKVHVRGVLTTCSASSALVTATEVKVQKP